jgi:phosphoserine phosphatase RsbU/P
VAEAANTPAALAGQGLRVLVVDDEPDIGRLLSVRLRSRGFEVDRAGDGAQALEKLEPAPDLMFLDVAMPGIGGLEVLQEVRRQALDTAVILMTAFGSEQVAIEALRRGADDYLRKPFEPVEFQAVLERTVTRLRLTRENAALQRQLDEKRRALEAELGRAARVQADLLPGAPPALAGYELAARCLPAREVGGDFYDWQQAVPGCLTLMFGDVMGKGMPAALMMATVRAAMRSVVRHSAPASAIQDVAAALLQDLERAEGFVTLFLGRLDLASGQLAYVDAGHGLTLLLRADGRFETLESRGMPLGVLPDERYQEGTAQLAPGDMLVLYSDGLTDAWPASTDRPGLIAGRLAGVPSASAALETLLAACASGTPLPDDLTVVVLRRQEAGG